MCEKSCTVKTENPIQVKAEVASKNEVMSMKKRPNNYSPQIKANTESPYLASRRHWGKKPNQANINVVHVI